MSWNICTAPDIRKHCVSLLVRLWVEICIRFRKSSRYRVSLLVRLWVEISGDCRILNRVSCQPPCEAVSWNTQNRHRLTGLISQPPCEAVSWNLLLSSLTWAVCVSLLVRLWVEIFLQLQLPYPLRQPPCEAVSWNIYFRHLLSLLSMSASLWGCELKWIVPLAVQDFRCQPPCEAVSWNVNKASENISTACQPPCEAVSWNMYCVIISSTTFVSLLVRLWVEISLSAACVSHRVVSLLVRLWVEIFYKILIFSYSPRQPPCEAVSWNIVRRLWFWKELCQPPCEAVSWNVVCAVKADSKGVSLLVRLWVEIICMDVKNI